MRIRTAFAAIIATLLISGYAAGQEPTDFLNLRGERVPLSISSDRVGVLVREETAFEKVRDFADSRGYKIVEQLPGGLYILDIGRGRERAELVQLPRMLQRQGGELIAQAGVVGTAPGIDNPIIVTDDLLVQFKPEVSEERIRSLVAENALSIVEASVHSTNQFVLRVDETSKDDALQISARFQSMTDLVDFAHPDFITVVEPREFLPNDPLFGRQWHHRNTGQDMGTEDADVDTSLAWDIEQGAAGTTIAIVDFGFEMEHPDLQPNLWENASEMGGAAGKDDDGNGYIDDFHGWDFVQNDNDPSGPDSASGSRHGTAVAGVAAARGDNGIGVTGSCPQCSLMLLRIGAASAVSKVAAAIRYAEHNGAAVISNSWGYPAAPTLENALNSAATSGRGGLGSVVFLAMNNSHVNDCGSSRLPSLDSVIAVGRSTNRDLSDDLASFGPCLDLLAPTAWLSTISSGRGTLWITTTDMLGPAGYNSNDILAPCPELVPPPAGALDYTRCFIGTSSSTPLTAGVAGLVLTASSSLTRSQVQRLLQDTADKIEDPVGAYSPGNGFSDPPSGPPGHGWGRLNAFEAVRVVASAARGGRAGVDLFLRDNRLDWGNTEQPSNTLFEAQHATSGHWESMDIKVDAPPYQMAPSAATFEGFIDETPSEVSGDVNRVYVRMRNRGPEQAATAIVKLQWAQFGTAAPPLPTDFWSQFPADPTDTSQWHPLNCAGTNTTTCTVANLGYSGASLATTSGDAARIVQFNFPAPAADPVPSTHVRLLALVDSPQDPIAPSSRASLIVDDITPTDNNLAQRDYMLAQSERAPSGVAPAECTAKQAEPRLDAGAELQWGGVSVPADDRQKIDDLFSRYAWALDQRDADRFAALFADIGSYEVCTGDGNVRIYIAPSNAEIRMKIREEFDETKNVFQPRHVLANTLLRRRDKDQTILESKTTMVVTVQRLEGDRVLPEPDYTAEVRGTLQKDADGNWKFTTLTVYADTPEFEPMGR